VNRPSKHADFVVSRAASEPPLQMEWLEPHASPSKRLKIY